MVNDKLENPIHRVNEVSVVDSAILRACSGLNDQRRALSIFSRYTHVEECVDVYFARDGRVIFYTQDEKKHLVFWPAIGVCRDAGKAVFRDQYEIFTGVFEEPLAPELARYTRVYRRRIG